MPRTRQLTAAGGLVRQRNFHDYPMLRTDEGAGWGLDGPVPPTPARG